MTARTLIDGKASRLLWVRTSDSVAEAARRMKTNAIGCLLVKDHGRCVGILSERDVVSRWVASGASGEEGTVGEIMTSPVVSCQADTRLAALHETMTRHSVRHLPITEGDDIVGMLSNRDLMDGIFRYESRMRELTIFSLAKLAESRDPDTGGHLERVCDYSAALADWLAQQPQYEQTIDSKFIALLRAASALHDIGKVSIPDCILLKPDRLDAGEFEVMKTHTVAGAETLGEALACFPEARFLQMGYEIAAYHHERIDGKGYPKGLHGDTIPLCARIFALADVYDALSSRRVYKRAMPHSIASKIIQEGAGTQFDEDVVRAFCACEELFQEIQDRRAAEQKIA